MHHLTPRAANLFAAALLCALLTSCKSHTQAETETHFLELCDGQCDEGLTCVCGACTDPCASDGDCAARSGVATCVGTPDACGSAVTSACDVECATKQDCGALGGAYECRAGRCRSAGALVVDASVPSTAGGGGSAGGAGSSGGVGGGSGVPDAGGAGSGGSSGSGGTSAGSGGSSGSGGAGAGGSGGSSGSGGTSAGSGGSSGSGGDAGVACDTVGATCCDPFPGDGVNYCEAGLSCVGDNTCQDCNCPLTGGPQVCGVDGLDYIAACGEACLPVAVACQGACPCQCVQDLATGCASTEPGGGTACCGGLVCCEGVPYDAAGECRTNCPFVSDRNAKTDIEPVDARAVLESVARLPIASWRYRTEPGARHVGPMAQDFAAELGLGADERVIAPVDASGVTLASIQALYAQVQALAQQNAELQRRLRQLEAAEAPVCR